MRKAEWFRRQKWTADDRKDFLARLNRTRASSQKAQYVRIQAVHLAEADTREGHAAALELIDMLLSTWPTETLQVIPAQHQKGKSLLALGDATGALASFRDCLQAQRATASIRTDAAVDFAWLVATTSVVTEYSQALAALDEFPEGPFPIQQYRGATARALILSATHRCDEAKTWASRALNAEAATSSPFRYHRLLGLVKNPNARVHAQLKTIAA